MVILLKCKVYRIVLPSYGHLINLKHFINLNLSNLPHICKITHFRNVYVHHWQQYMKHISVALNQRCAEYGSVECCAILQRVPGVVPEVSVAAADVLRLYDLAHPRHVQWALSLATRKAIA